MVLHYACMGEWFANGKAPFGSFLQEDKDERIPTRAEDKAFYNLTYLYTVTGADDCVKTTSRLWLL